MNIIGYGSLMSPYCVSGLFSDSNKKEIYNERRILSENVVSDKSIDTIKNKIINEFSFIPIKLDGFKRTYTYMSKRGGTMLEAHRTNDSSDFINAIILSDLSDKQFNKIQKLEDNYKEITVSTDEIDFYIDKHENFSEDCAMFISNKEFISNYESRVPRNPTYNSRILKGIELLEYIYSKELMFEFKSDFIESTIEHPHHNK